MLRRESEVVLLFLLLCRLRIILRLLPICYRPAAIKPPNAILSIELVILLGFLFTRNGPSQTQRVRHAVSQKRRPTRIIEIGIDPAKAV